MIDPELRELYQEVILDHGRNPRHFGVLAEADRQAEGYNPLCGDQIRVFLKLDDDGRITDVQFDGKGCAISIASASMMTELIVGKSLAEARALMTAFLGLAKGEPGEADGVDPDDLERLQVMAGVSQFPMRVKCATLAWHTFNAACEGANKVTTE